MNGQQFFKGLMSKAREGIVEMEESVEVRKALDTLPDVLFASGVEMELDTVNDRMVFSFMMSKVAVYAKQVSTTKVELRYEVLEDFDNYMQKLKDFDIRGGSGVFTPRQPVPAPAHDDEVWAKLERRLASF